jgi:hypothetical protein
MNNRNERFPILLWGDLVRGDPPVLRRALAGFRAHECMYAWVYLTEYLALARLLDLLLKMSADDRRELLISLDENLWKKVDRSIVDPHFQLTKSSFESIAHMACLATQTGETYPTFVELGSTFFASKTKFEIVDQIGKERFKDWPKLQPKWIGIDNSRFMHDSTRALHGEGAVDLVEDYRAVVRPDGLAVFLSRFVPSYVYSSSIEFASYLADRFQVALVEDAYSTIDQDVAVFNHGQPEIFFAIPKVMGLLAEAGFDIFVLETYPDYPADAAPCHVIRYIATKKGLLTKRVKEYLAGLGMNSPYEPISARTLLGQLNASVTPRRWRAVEQAKRQSPVWGRTPEVSDSGPWKSFTSAAKELIGRYFRYPGWHHYRLSGPMVVREIDRALSAEKPEQ